MADAKEPGRRDALRTLIGAGGAALGCAVVVPGLVFVVGPARGSGGGGRWVRTVKLDALREGEPKRVSIVADERDAWTLTKDVELGAAWLVRRGDRVLAWSATCPHLGCAIRAGDGAGEGGFSCPCHASTFASDGKRGEGPSPRDMDALATKVEEGFVVVDFRKYRTGTPEKVEIG